MSILPGQLVSGTYSYYSSTCSPVGLELGEQSHQLLVPSDNSLRAHAQCVAQWPETITAGAWQKVPKQMQN